MKTKTSILLLQSLADINADLHKPINDALTSLNLKYEVTIEPIKELTHISPANSDQILIISNSAMNFLSADDFEKLTKLNIISVQLVQGNELKTQKNKYIFSRLLLDSSTSIIEEQLCSFLEIHHLRKKLREMDLNTEKKFKMATLGEMNATLAHEINNPLTIILGQIGLMKKYLPEESTPKLTNGFVKIEQTVTRISKIIKSFKTLSRDDKNDLPNEVSINKVIKDSANVCSDKLTKQKIKLNIEDFDSANVICKEIQVSQILVNLIHNSIDATRTQDSPSIDIKTKVDKGVLKIAVSDSGEKICSTIKDDIFKPFFTTKPKGEGTGLGLSHSKAMAQENGGDLKMLQDEDKTTFELSLPIIPKNF